MSQKRNELKVLGIWTNWSHGDMPVYRVVFMHMGRTIEFLYEAVDELDALRQFREATQSWQKN